MLITNATIPQRTMSFGMGFASQSGPTLRRYQEIQTTLKRQGSGQESNKRRKKRASDQPGSSTRQLVETKWKLKARVKHRMSQLLHEGSEKEIPVLTRMQRAMKLTARVKHRMSRILNQRVEGKEKEMSLIMQGVKVLISKLT
jgi:hypothetical protein